MERKYSFNFTPKRSGRKIRVNINTDLKVGSFFPPKGEEKIESNSTIIVEFELNFESLMGFKYNLYYVKITPHEGVKKYMMEFLESYLLSQESSLILYYDTQFNNELNEYCNIYKIVENGYYVAELQGHNAFGDYIRLHTYKW